MKRIFYLFFFLVLLGSCNRNPDAENEQAVRQSPDTSETESLPIEPTEPESRLNNADLLKLNQTLLEFIKNKNWTGIQPYIHEDWGLQFSPYAHLNRQEDVTLQKATFPSAMKGTKKLNWGSFDGTGEPINLTPLEYFERFVYDVDFLMAEKTTVNTSSVTGNVINNIGTIFPDSKYVENYFSGFNPDYEGMDWRALRLVFKEDSGNIYLVAIVHDQWTT